ncbi:PhoX family phosphatase [Mesorhizobium sp. VK9D]|uniref:PhoX family protein n=1 Tax=Mesorhizobium australafricanum TaxID=3072311 RepID=UPI002A24A504|nr:PhoX family phosphatase [Mesorhizobium sp. VK9D]MDX8451758.1 PhoX family phosphatase [Mesorhizobium sp. VK9D]
MANSPSSSSPVIRDVIAARVSRRELLKSGLASGALIAGGSFVGSLFAGETHAAAAQSTLGFPELKRVYDKTHAAAEGYETTIVARWGDPLAAGLAEFDGNKVAAEEQEKRFGYNCDYIAFMPLPKDSVNSDHGLLCVNNEYISPNMMFPGMTEDDAGKTMTREQVDLGLAAMGHSIVEVMLKDGKWQTVEDSPLNRRITANTEMVVSGPVAGHALMQTSADASGRKILGTSYNCSGGVTPWGTVLTCEEGVSDLFGGDPKKAPTADVLDRYGFDGSDIYGRGRFHDRFNIDKEPNEPNRFDWVVEIDPYDPQSKPVKRSALGRMSHEASTVMRNKDGRIVVYMGDDDYFEYMYRFVSAKPYDPANPASAKDLLDDGVLSVARFDADGSMSWLPLVHGQGKLTADNGFADQAEVLLKTRLAADAVGATPMDRPEDIETNPVTGRVYAVMTKNKKRDESKVNPANTRPENLWGHIVELIPPGGRGVDADHTADKYAWDLFVLCGNPKDAKIGATFHPDTSDNGWFVCPDNITFDPAGRLWVATDGANDFDLPDGVYGVDTEGAARGLPKLLFTCPHGAEATGPCFTPDGTTLFLSVQHPSEDAETLDKAQSLWPDFKDGQPPRPSVVAIRRKDGQPVGA